MASPAIDYDLAYGDPSRRITDEELAKLEAEALAYRAKRKADAFKVLYGKYPSARAPRRRKPSGDSRA